jgi:hypothetical protein
MTHSNVTRLAGRTWRGFWAALILALAPWPA